MNPRLLLILTIMLTRNLLAQPSAIVTSSNASTPDVPAPAALSKATLDKIAKMTALFDGKTLAGWESDTNAWMVKDGAMGSTGAGRGVIYTKGDYGSFRLIFNMRHVSGQPDHQAWGVGV